MSKMTGPQIFIELAIFAVLFVVLLFLGLDSSAISARIFSNDHVALSKNAIEPRDRIYGVDVLDNGIVWMVGSNGKIVRSPDAGATFEVQRSPVRQDLQGIKAWDSQRAVIVGNLGIVLITDDGGVTWREVENIPRSEIANKLFKVETLDGGRAYAVGVMGAIICTEDYGKTWSRTVEEQDVAWNDIVFVNNEKGWVVGEFGMIMHTGDGGQTWEEQETPTDGSLMSIEAVNEIFLRACGLEGTILTTRDGGQTWDIQRLNTREHLLAFTHEEDAWVGVGTGGIVFTYQVDAGWNLKRLAPHELAWHTDIVKLAKEQYIIVGQTTGIWNKVDWKLLR
jgi:photosystem II stability/assembly factor-like uncharacterized protein